MPENSPMVVVASDDAVLLDQLVRFLEELPHWRLLSSARSGAEVQKTLSTFAPDAVVISGGIAEELDRMRVRIPTRVVVLARRDDPKVLRSALKIGAAGFVIWPNERSQIRSLVEAGIKRSESLASRGSLIAMWSPKGGSGTSCLTAHLAASLGSKGTRTTLLDLDLDHADQSPLLSAESETKGLADLLRVADELTPSVVESVSWSHPLGFKAVLSPGISGESDLVKVPDLVRIAVAVCETADKVIVDLPSGIGELPLAFAEQASPLFMIVTPDYLSLRRAREALRAIQSGGIALERIHLILNRADRKDISVSDVEAVLARPVALRVPSDLGLLKASDRGEISTSGLRLMDPLARKIAGLPELRRSALAALTRR